MNQSDKHFLNPTIQSPWSSTAPKSMPSSRKKRTSVDENNNVAIKQARQPTVTRFVSRNEQPPKEYKPNFNAYSGYFHSYYEATKRSLLEHQLRQQKALELEANFAQKQEFINFPCTPVNSNEVIEIPDSPTAEDRRDCLEPSLLRHFLQSPKPGLVNQPEVLSEIAPPRRYKFENYFAPMQFMSGPESLRAYRHNPNAVKGAVKGPVTRSRVGIVIRKKERGYVSRLL